MRALFLSAEAASRASSGEYHYRASQVYWRGEDGADACRAKGGRHGAECLLLDGHRGDHYGSGFDQWGPIPGIRWATKGER